MRIAANWLHWELLVPPLFWVTLILTAPSVSRATQADKLITVWKPSIDALWSEISMLFIAIDALIRESDEFITLTEIIAITIQIPGAKVTDKISVVCPSSHGTFAPDNTVSVPIFWSLVLCPGERCGPLHINSRQFLLCAISPLQAQQISLPLGRLKKSPRD